MIFIINLFIELRHDKFINWLYDVRGLFKSLI